MIFHNDGDVALFWSETHAKKLQKLILYASVNR